MFTTIHISPTPMAKLDEPRIFMSCWSRFADSPHLKFSKQAWIKYDEPNHHSLGGCPLLGSKCLILLLKRGGL
jgi:hypothetical protein